MDDLRDLERARDRIKQLSEGLDPDTGELLASDHVCQRAETVRALFRAVAALDLMVRRERGLEIKKQTGQLPANTGKSWDAEEDQNLLAALKAGRTLDQIALDHQRTTEAVRLRAERLGWQAAGGGIR
ncbi:MAG: hypothetical protein R3D27_01820 [Hyphomicrobiaceae bacterium]